MVQIVQVREVEGVNVGGEVRKRMVRRAQEAVKPLDLGVWVLVYIVILANLDLMMLRRLT